MQKRIGLRSQCGKGILANTLATHAPGVARGLLEQNLMLDHRWRFNLAKF